MSYVDKKTGLLRYSLKEKQDYHNRMAKKGAIKFDTKSKRYVNVSDFERGAHKAMANMIFQRRKRFAEKMANGQSNFNTNKHVVKSVPPWYKNYEKGMSSNIKNFETNESLDSLRNYFK